MNEFFASIAESMRKRATTALLGTYATFWLLFHWQTWYTTLFVNEEKIFKKFDMTKNEYVFTYFISPRWDDLVFYLGYIIPAILTLLFIWVLPKYLFLPAFQAERNYKLAKRRIVIRGETLFEKDREKLASQNTKVLKAEKAATEVKQQIIELDPKVKLAEEYDTFMDSSDAAEALDEITKTIYSHGGTLGRYRGETGWERNDVNPELLAKAHSNELVEFDKDSSHIKLTDKGKYFISRYR